MPRSYTELRAWYTEAEAGYRQWQRSAEESYEFVAGRQYSRQDERILKLQGRPMIAFNRIAYVVEAVAGAEIANRQEVRYIPREPGDVRVNEVMTSGAEWVRDRCLASDEESDAFRDMVICGLGYTDTRMSYDEDPEGQIIIERVDPFEMLVDPVAQKRNLRDARYVFRVQVDIPIEVARDMFPDVEDSLLDAGWAWPQTTTRSRYGRALSGDDYEVGDPQLPKLGIGRSGDSSRDDDDHELRYVTLVECQYRDHEPVWEVDDEMFGSATFEDHSMVRTYVQRLRELQRRPRVVQRSRTVYRRAFIGAQVLEDEELDPQEGGFRIKTMTGLRDRNAGTWHGLVESGKDPQRWANKWLSQTMHIMNSNAKGGIFAEESAFVNPAKAAEDYPKANPIIFVTGGALQNGKIQERQMANYPEGFSRLMEFAILSIRDCMGVNPELLGQADRNQPGVLEYQRRQAGMMILAPLFDAMRQYRIEQGTLLLHLIRRYLADGRLMRLVNAEQQQWVPLVDQPGTAEYDVIVDETPDTPSQRDRIWQIMQTMIPMLQQVGAPPEVWAEVVKHSPVPATMADKMVQGLLQARQDPEVQQAKMMEMQAAMAEIAKTSADTQKAQASAEYDRARAATERPRQQSAALAEAAKAAQMAHQASAPVTNGSGTRS